MSVDRVTAPEFRALPSLEQQRLGCQYLDFCTSKASKLSTRSICIQFNKDAACRDLPDVPDVEI